MIVGWKLWVLYCKFYTKVNKFFSLKQFENFLKDFRGISWFLTPWIHPGSTYKLIFKLKNRLFRNALSSENPLCQKPIANQFTPFSQFLPIKPSNWTHNLIYIHNPIFQVAIFHCNLIKIQFVTGISHNTQCHFGLILHKPLNMPSIFITFSVADFSSNSQKEFPGKLNWNNDID